MRAVIVEDSAEDRLNLRALLRHCQGIEIVGEAANLNQARQILAEPGIDLLFLDIQIGRESGFDLLGSLGPRPHVILTTVHRQYGEWAFDHDVTDYLVKPITEDRLQRALRRAEKQDGGSSLARIAVHRSGSARQMIAIETIVAVVGDDKYSRVISGSTEYPDHRSLREWHDLLQEWRFERIDRSTLVRPERILALRLVGRGARVSFIHSAIEVEIGRSGRERLESVLTLRKGLSFSQ
jgi:two-component system LytT family response regulator